ncbi:MAG: glycosyltransferase family 4 protein [Gemmatimonadales bacterium]
MPTDARSGSGESETIAIDARMIGASGIGTYLTQLLPRVVAGRHQYRFVLLGPASTLKSLDWTDVPNVRIINVDAPIYSLREQIAILAAVPWQADLFWSPHYNIPVGWRGRLAVTVHDLAPLALPDLFPGVHRQAYARFMFRRVSRGADAIIAPSEFTRGELERLTGVARTQPDVVPLGVDRSWFQVEQSPRPHDKPYLLYVGNVKPHKNLGRLLQAFSGLQSRISCDLLILGKKEGLLTPDDEVQTAANDLGSRVQLLGTVPQDMLKRYVAQAEALVLPSLYEGFGLPPLEAMACGVPTIVSHAASLPEVCGNAALYCDPHDTNSIAGAMVKVLEDAKLRETLRCRGLERARGFTWERTAEATLNILGRVLAA